MSKRDPDQPKNGAAKDGAGPPPDRPDVLTGFQPGQSPNRKGRPKGARGRKQIVRQIALESHKIRENGEIRRRTTLDLVLLSLRNRAVGGDVRAFREVHQLLQRYAPQLAVKKGGFLIVPAPIPEEEWLKLVYEYQRKGRGEPVPEDTSVK